MPDYPKKGRVVLEPDAMKVASPVLRGEWFSNELFLPYPDRFRHSTSTLNHGDSYVLQQF